ncbi:hypothetical protein ACIO3R_32230 [Streptomyces sp. NPDC087428]|uniref:hypothetical protein n=1 Tax=Streptomyces sp. NPDC087428 TaxID=3365788 RepID=UPI00382FF9D1
MSAPTPQEIGIHALAKAVEYADKADLYANATYSSVQQNAAHIAIYGDLATVYADIAKAAALTADNA